MKFFIFILIISSCIILINSTCRNEQETVKIRDEDDCIRRTFSTEEANNGAYKCCFIRYYVDGNDYDGRYYGCIYLDNSQYNSINSVRDYYEKNFHADYVVIDCKANYLKISLLGLILLFF